MDAPYRTPAEVPEQPAPKPEPSPKTGHLWDKVGESEVRTHDAATGIWTKKTQSLWVCEKCGAETMIDGSDHPDSKDVLYAMEPLELDGTIIADPEIPHCDVVQAKKS